MIPIKLILLKKKNICRVPLGGSERRSAFFCILILQNHKLQIALNSPNLRVVAVLFARLNKIHAIYFISTSN
ncbi:hypothetical protein BpHYR1_016697 [Brachionus plicatilis]|uniref:Uncharacterized protein n=1 Tax=Brachionus plicatilis TaxID=10195 RepID=A0A3M7RHR8_BRAPC|nr:hypothetical protein BpHYR1_016697 [Brachionus plicatilis]